MGLFEVCYESKNDLKFLFLTCEVKLFHIQNLKSRCGMFRERFARKASRKVFLNGMQLSQKVLADGFRRKFCGSFAESFLIFWSFYFCEKVRERFCGRFCGRLRGKLFSMVREFRKRFSRKVLWKVLRKVLRKVRGRLKKTTYFPAGAIEVVVVIVVGPKGADFL